MYFRLRRLENGRMAFVPFLKIIRCLRLQIPTCIDTETYIYIGGGGVVVERVFLLAGNFQDIFEISIPLGPTSKYFELFRICIYLRSKLPNGDYGFDFGFVENSESHGCKIISTKNNLSMFTF